MDEKQDLGATPPEILGDMLTEVQNQDSYVSNGALLSIIEKGMHRRCIDEILKLLEKRGERLYFGQPLSQLEHALQCARIAEEEGDRDDDEMIIAALLHDIGHLCNPSHTEEADPANGTIGAEFLRSKGFSERVCQLVYGQIESKRYQASRGQQQGSKLTSSAKRALHLQDGPMSLKEAAEYEKSPSFKDEIFLRSCDDRAKVPGREVPRIEDYRDLLIRHLQEQALIAREYACA